MKKHEFALKSEDDRKPRNIFNPHHTIKATLGLINYNLLKLSKRLNKSFIHGMNTEQVAERI